MSVVGFAIGNENSYVAAVKDGGIEVIDNEYCLRSTPTYVAFAEKSRDVGVSAKSKVITNFENTIFGFKKVLGKKFTDHATEAEFSYIPLEGYEIPPGYVGFKVNYLTESVTFTVNQLMAMMLTKLKLTSEAKLGKIVNDCVISVPVYFIDAQRRAMFDAACIAGLNPLKLVNESAAVALLYGFYKKDLHEEQPHNVVFVDLGNSSLTVTVCAFTTNKLRILGYVWENVGGRDFDNILVQYFVDDFKCKYKLDVLRDKKALLTLMIECELLKKMMSANSLELKLQIECFMQGVDVEGKMKREWFENLSAPVLDKIEKTFQRILDKTGLKISDIDSVEMIGGSCRIPAVKFLIQKVFGLEPKSTLNQDEAVVRGCALQCALLSPSLKTRNFVIEDIYTFPIKISWINLELTLEEAKLLSPGDKIPTFKLITLNMKRPFSLDVYYDYPNVPLEIRKIGTFTFEGVPSDISAESAKLQLKACINIHGIFSIISAKMMVKNVSNLSDKIISEENKTEVSNDTAVNIIEDENETKTNVLLYELSIVSDVPSLSSERLKEFAEKEKQMINKDRMEKEEADARNSLEEYIYDTRGKLCYEYNDYVSEIEKKYLLLQLTNTEDWLYNNENEGAPEYSRKLNDLKNNFDPVVNRHYEWTKHPVVVNEYSNVLQQSLDNINKLLDNAKDTNFQDDLESLREMYQKSKDYLDQTLDTCSNLEKYEDIPVTVNELRKTLDEFKNDFQKSYIEIRNKITHASVLGDGKEMVSTDGQKENNDDQQSGSPINEVINGSQD